MRRITNQYRLENLGRGWWCFVTLLPYLGSGSVFQPCFGEWLVGNPTKVQGTEVQHNLSH